MASMVKSNYAVGSRNRAHSAGCFVKNSLNTYSFLKACQEQQIFSAFLLQFYFVFFHSWYCSFACLCYRDDDSLGGKTDVLIKNRWSYNSKFFFFAIVNQTKLQFFTENLIYVHCIMVWKVFSSFFACWILFFSLSFALWVVSSSLERLSIIASDWMGFINEPSVKYIVSHSIRRWISANLARPRSRTESSRPFISR